MTIKVSRNTNLDDVNFRNRSGPNCNRPDILLYRNHDVFGSWVSSNRQCKCSFLCFYLLQISFLMGIVALVGPQYSFQFFQKKAKGSLFYFAGFVLIVLGYPMFTLLGFLCQVWGMFLMFRSFLKTIFAYMQTLPVIGPLLRDTPFIHDAVNWASSKGKA